jgi:hypothetical protein
MRDFEAEFQVPGSEVTLILLTSHGKIRETAQTCVAFEERSAERETACETLNDYKTKRNLPTCDTGKPGGLLPIAAPIPVVVVFIT